MGRNIKAMPGKGAEYALNKNRHLRENLLKEVASHRSRARETEKYLLASQRNSLEQQRDSLRVGLEKLPIEIRQHYMERMAELSRRIDRSKSLYPNFRGANDS